MSSSSSSSLRRRHRRLAFGLFLLLGFHVGVWAVQLGGLAAALRLDPGQLGLALSGAAAGGIVTLFLGGRIADRLGRRPVLVAGFGVSGLAFAGLAVARTFPEVVAAVVLYGLTISFVDLGANAVGADYEAAHGLEALTGLQAGFSLGAVLGALGSALLLGAGVDYRLVYAGLAAVFVVAAAALLRAGLPQRAVVTQGEEERGGFLRNRGVLFATAVVLVSFFGDGALEGFTAVFLREALASGALLSGIGIAGFHLASFTGRLLAQGVLQRVGTRVVITSAGCLAAVGTALAVLSPVAWGSIAGLLIVGFAISPVVPGAISLSGRSAPGRSGGAVAFTTAVGYTSFLISPLVVGAVSTATDLRVGLSLVAVTSVVIAMLGSRWPSRSMSGPSNEVA